MTRFDIVDLSKDDAVNLLQKLARSTRLLDPVLRRDFGFQDPAERYVRAIAEEAGEVAGAYNKWQDGRTDKPKTPDDIAHEMAQVIGCCFLLALQLGYTPEELLARADRFLTGKRLNAGDESYSVRGTP